MDLQEAMDQLEALGHEKMRNQNIRHGAGEQQFGVRRGDVRRLAKTIKTNHELALELWQTGNLDARFLAILLFRPKDLTVDAVDHMVRSVTFVEVADWFTNYVAKKHPEKEELRQRWMHTDHGMAGRAGWSLTNERLQKSAEGLDVPGLLERLASEMAGAAPEAQWTMNFALVEIGTRYPELRGRALAIGEELGLYRDYPVSKGCTSPFAPIAIQELANR